MASRPRATRTKNLPPIDTVKVDCFLLCDAAQESGGKIYVMGGGWNQITVEGPQSITPPMAIAIRFLIPWNETNRDLNVMLQLRDEDGNLLIPEPPMLQMNVGRPPGIAPIDQPVHVALGIPQFQFPRQGDYAFILTLDDVEIGRAKFRVFFTKPS